MRFTLFTLALIISGGLFAQTAELSPYQKKTMNTCTDAFCACLDECGV